MDRGWSGNYLEIFPDMRKVTLFFSLLEACFQAVSIKRKRQAIIELLNFDQWLLLYKNKNSGCSIYAESYELDYRHELKAAEALTQEGYHVLFAPKALFKREDKKFDVFLIHDHFIFQADLKNIHSKNPETISNRIAEGARQASRIVVVIQSDLKKKILINGLRSGYQRSNSLIEIFLFYRGRFFRLNKKDIESDKIYKLL